MLLLARRIGVHIDCNILNNLYNIIYLCLRLNSIIYMYVNIYFNI